MPTVDPASPRVVAVVVAFDRRDLLAQALTAVLGQTRAPDEVVVLDNASSDGSAAMVAERFGPAVDLVVLERNTGGAGGFALGMARALEVHDADAVWVLDDDTVPEPGALAALVRAWQGGAALAASRVRWTDGRDHPMNTPRPRPGVRDAVRPDGTVEIRSASFVSCLLDGGALRAAGMPVADYFLWNDDFELTARVLRRRTGVWVPASVVEHSTRTFGDSAADPGERFYLEVRNKVWLLTRSRALGPRDRLLYGGATVRRWARTLARSSRRDVLLACLRAGLADGVRRGPRPNRVVLERAAGVDDVAALDLRAQVTR